LSGCGPSSLGQGMVAMEKGFSLQINGGTTYGGFYARFKRTSWRICLGWLAVSLFFFDVEPVLGRLAAAQRKEGGK
jgi:hypothetical protein